MARPRTIGVKRRDPDLGGLEDWIVTQVDDPISATTNLRITSYSEVGLPLWWKKIADKVTTEGRDYPYDGTGGIQASPTPTTTTVTIAANADTLDWKDLYFLFMTGPNAGEVRRISDYNTGTRLVTFASAMPQTPASTNLYRILIPGWPFHALHVKTEFEDSIANQGFADIAIKLFGLPSGITGFDAIRRVENLGIQDADTVESAYRHAALYSVQSRGALGAKVHVKDIDGSAKKISLWVGGT